MTIETPPAQSLLPFNARMLQPDFLARCDEVAAKFRSAQLGDIALRLAKVHPYAPDYIEQAPILVLACHVMRRNRPDSLGTARRAPPSQRDPRSDRIEARTRDVLEWWRDRCDRRFKLGQLLRSFKIAPEFRALKPGALRPSAMWAVTIMSGQMTGPEIAPIIPETATAQRAWLNALVEWYGHMLRRNNRAMTGFPAGLDHPTCLTTWAAKAFARAPHKRLGRGVPSEIGDFALSFTNRTPIDPNSRFDPRWTLEQAADACGRWHNRDAGEEMNDLGFVHQYGVQPDWPAPCDGFPDLIEVAGDWTVALLRTGRDLYREHVALSHCVDGYFGDVQRGASIIYSIRQGGERVATLELRKCHNVNGFLCDGERAGRSSIWVPSQFKAKSNHAPLSPAWCATASALCKLHDDFGLPISVTDDTRWPSAEFHRLMVARGKL